MHTDLSAHLHSPECNDLIKKLHTCHQEHTVKKFFGYCNSIDTALTKCLKGERLKRRQLNYEKSLEMKAKLRRLYEQERQQKQEQ